jgi:hypothetical protein
VRLDGRWCHEEEIGMSGVIRAPQYGLPHSKTPRLTVREIQTNRRRITQEELAELAELMKRAV